MQLLVKQQNQLLLNAIQRLQCTSIYCILMGECNTILNAYTLYDHLEYSIALNLFISGLKGGSSDLGKQNIIKILKNHSYTPKAL